MTFIRFTLLPSSYSSNDDNSEGLFAENPLAKCENPVFRLPPVVDNLFRIPPFSPSAPGPPKVDTPLQPHIRSTLSHVATQNSYTQKYSSPQYFDSPPDIRPQKYYSLQSSSLWARNLSEGSY